MVVWLLAIDIMIAIALLLLGLIVFIRNSRTLLHRVFFAFVLSLAAWIIMNYLSNLTSLPYSQALYANRFTLFFPALVMAAMLAFVTALVGIKAYSRFMKPLIAINTLNGALTLTPLVVQNVAVQGSVFAITFGPLASIYFGIVILNAIFVGVVLSQGIKKSVGRERSSLVIIFWSILAAIAITLVTNAALPYFVNSFVLTHIGPLSTVLVAGGLYYSIAKHRLFDIRPVIARAAGYLLTIAVLALIYGVIVFGVAGFLFDIRLPLSFEIFVSVATGLASLSFHNFKKRFDRITNTLFYQDAYDTQQLFDEYNKTLVSTIELDELLKRSSQVVAKHLKASFCVVGIGGNDFSQIRIGGSARDRIAKDDVKYIHGLIASVKQSVVVVDNLPPRAMQMRSMLQRHDISLVIRLTPSMHAKQNSLGYMILGTKLSGNSYTYQDAKVAEALANELYIALQNALRFEEIEKFNETLQQKVEDATLRLRSANQKLKELNANKDDFIGMASHQLRTPLTSVKGYVSLVMDGDAGPVNEQQYNLLRQAFVSSQRMVYLIADLLNISRLKTGKFVIERAPTDLAKLIGDELQQLKETAATRNLGLEFKPPAHFPIVELDETKMRQVIMNFIDNAIYYTPAGGHIRIELEELSRTVELRVVDDGIGVPKAEQHQLWAKFYRAKNAQRARPDGTGLGLYMAKKVIAGHGGSIIFNSEEGRGSTFGFSVPKEAPAKLPQLTA